MGRLILLAISYHFVELSKIGLDSWGCLWVLLLPCHRAKDPSKLSRETPRGYRSEVQSCTSRNLPVCRFTSFTIVVASLGEMVSIHLQNTNLNFIITVSNYYFLIQGNVGRLLREDQKIQVSRLDHLSGSDGV